MIHSIEKLVFIDKTTNAKVHQAKQCDEPRRWENAVNRTYVENENCLREVESVTKDWRLNQLRVIFTRLANNKVKSNLASYLLVSSLRAGKRDTSLRPQTLVIETGKVPGPEAR